MFIESNNQNVKFIILAIWRSKLSKMYYRLMYQLENENNKSMVLTYTNKEYYIFFSSLS